MPKVSFAHVYVAIRFNGYLVAMRCQGHIKLGCKWLNKCWIFSADNKMNGPQSSEWAFLAGAFLEEGVCGN